MTAIAGAEEIEKQSRQAERQVSANRPVLRRPVQLLLRAWETSMRITTAWAKQAGEMEQENVFSPKKPCSVKARSVCV